MDERPEQMQKRFLELAERAYQNCTYTFTPFLGLQEQSVFHGMERMLSHVPWEVFGGVEGCERKMVRFGSEEFCGKIFYSSELKSSTVADDDAEWWKACYWCGTRTIETKDGTRTINEYAKDLDAAIKIVRKKFLLFNKGDPRFKSDECDKLRPKDKAGEERCSSTGSGFFVSENIVVTCAHVVKGGRRIACVVGCKTEKTCDILA